MQIWGLFKDEMLLLLSFFILLLSFRHAELNKVNLYISNDTSTLKGISLFYQVFHSSEGQNKISRLSAINRKKKKVKKKKKIFPC